MSWNDPDLETKFAEALKRFKWGEVDELCQQTVARIKSESSPMNEKLARRLLYLLRRKRRFTSIVQLAEVLVRSGVDSLPVRRAYAQALIDQGVFTPAELLLSSVVANAPENAEDNREARGLIGRIYKQVYVNNNDPASTANRANLERALKEYLEVYERNPTESRWHGINAVALLARADRDGFPIAGARGSEDLAREILAAIEEKDTGDEPLPAWDIATKIEAYVALRDENNAASTARAYVESNADAFEIFSTLRQFQEVWQLKETESPGSLLLPVLRTGHLEKSGAMAQGNPKEFKAEAQALDHNMEKLEAVFGPDRMQTYKWYRQGLERCNSIARIERRNGQGHGTGWLVKASDFFSGEQGVLVLTNDHVITKVETPNQLAIFPQDCQVNFQAMEEVLEVEENVRWASPYTQLDATFLKLKREPKAPPLPLHTSAVKMSEPPPRMYIIGHPRGRDLEISMQDNYLVACNDSLVHYRTPTEPGSSGSPVFESNAWEVVALHHKGKDKMKRIDGQDGFYEANEGVSMIRIQSATAAGKSS